MGIPKITPNNPNKLPAVKRTKSVVTGCIFMLALITSGEINWLSINHSIIKTINTFTTITGEIKKATIMVGISESQDPKKGITLKIPAKIPKSRPYFKPIIV